MKIRSLNNATVYVESNECSLLIDPWLVGTLYGGAWSPYATCKNLDFLKKVTHLFISHIHEDHWDKETLKLLHKDVEIYIPEMQINGVLKKYIEQIGFSNIKLLKPFTKINFSDINLTIVPPMNAFGQELGSYESGYEFDATHIDTSLLVEDLITKTSHLFLCDNTPYDLSILDSIKFENLTSVWYPFNSYAQDYPVCYKLSNTEKAKIHKIMHKKTRDAIEACLKKLSPKYYFPHSADFVLNGPMSQSFENYKDNKYMDRELTAHTYSFSSLPNSISSYANYGDELEFLSNGNLKIHRDKFGYELVSSTPSLNNFQSVLKEKHSYLIEKAFSKMLQRCKKFKIDLSGASDWTIILNVDDYEDVFSYKELRLLREDEFLGKSKLLKIKLGKSQFDALMCRELHWNNAQIGYHLQFQRIPNEYCQELYKSLNFFHL